MNPEDDEGRERGCNFPRASGDEPLQGRVLGCMLGFSPREWG